MATVKTWLRVIPSFDNKRMTINGVVAVNEKVDVTVVGVVDDENEEQPVSEGLVLRLVSTCGRMEYARFPAKSEDSWEISGEDALCVMDLNTPALRRVFSHKCVDDTIEAVVLLEDGVPDNLYGTGRITLRNWVQNPCDPVAGSNQILDSINILTGRMDNHTHDGEDSSRFPHDNLLGRDDAGCHPVIENNVAMALDNAQTAINNSITANQNAAIALQAAQDASQEVLEAKGWVTDALGGMATTEYVDGEVGSAVSGMEAYADSKVGALEGTVQNAIALAELIQDGQSLYTVNDNASLGQVKILLNLVVSTINAWREEVSP